MNEKVGRRFNNGWVFRVETWLAVLGDIQICLACTTASASSVAPLSSRASGSSTSCLWIAGRVCSLFLMLLTAWSWRRVILVIAGVSIYCSRWFGGCICYLCLPGWWRAGLKHGFVQAFALNRVCSFSHRDCYLCCNEVTARGTRRGERQCM